MAKPEARSAATDMVSGPVAKQKSTAREYAEALGVALLLALLIRMFVVQAFKIPSGSMLPTLQIGDHILVNKFIYGARIEIPLTQVSLGQLPGLHEPRPGDVIVFIWPKDRSKDFIKRVIAVGGQTVEARSKQVYITGKPWDDPHATFTPPRGGRLGEGRMAALPEDAEPRAADAFGERLAVGERQQPVVPAVQHRRRDVERPEMRA